MKLSEHELEQISWIIDTAVYSALHEYDSRTSLEPASQAREVVYEETVDKAVDKLRRLVG
jgi:hypothetical protein